MIHRGAAGVLLALGLLQPAAADRLKDPVAGPKLVCFRYSTFTLLQGERVTDFTGGPEGMSIRIAGVAGPYEIDESDNSAGPSGPRQLLLTHGHTSVYQVAGRKRTYTVYTDTGFYEGKEQFLIVLSGQALRGKSKDADIYRRFDVRDPSKVTCDATFTYGWDFFMHPPKTSTAKPP